MDSIFDSPISASRHSSTKRKLPENFGYSKEKRAKLDDTKISISSLPNEILIEIFSNLKCNSLLNACLVNKNWLSLIINTKSTKQKINRLYIDDAKIDDFYIPKLTRNYESIFFEEITDFKPELIELMKDIGKAVQDVLFIDCVFFYSEFTSIISCFPNLCEMRVIGCVRGITPFNEDTIPEKIELDMLRSLVVKDYSWPLENIYTPNLERFEAVGLSLGNQENLICFLNEQRALKVLCLFQIRDLFDTSVIAHRELKPQFLLKEIVLFDLWNADEVQVINFLRSMETSIEFVDIGIEMEPTICEYILLNFKQTKRLKLDIECLPSYYSFFLKMDENKNLNYLALYGNITSSKFLRKFLQKHPLLEELMMSELRGLHPQKFEFWKTFSHILPKLKALAIRQLNIDNINFIRLKDLKHFDVESIGYITESSWSAFCKNNSNIEDLHIFGRYQEYYHGLHNVLVTNLTNLKDLFISNLFGN